jgi:diacylglycerol kinase (ATP)
VTTVAALINPAAGGGRGAAVARRALARLRSRGVDVREFVGRDAADAARLAREAAAHADALVVVGGDGLVGIALQVLAGTEVPLGIVPAGTGNDHARAYGVPRRNPDRAADVIADGHTRTVDVGRVQAADGTAKYFGTVLAAGFDSLVSDRANRMRWPRGQVRYNLAVLAELANLRPLPFRVVLDDERFAQDVVLTAVGNTSSYGGGLRICPEADPADGLLDVTVIRAMPRWRLVRLFPTLYAGTHLKLDDVEMYRTERVRLDSPGIDACADGEHVGPLPVEVHAVPQALRVLTPAARQRP